MRSMPLLLSAAAILATYGLTQFYAAPTGTRMPDRNIAELPMQLGQWTGEDREVSDRLFEAVGADQIVNRVYTRPDGATVSLHLAVFSNHGLHTPHHPFNCYGGAGMQGITEREIQIDGPGSRACFLTAEREGAESFALFWYQFGGRNVLWRDDLRRESWSFQGEKAWPPVIKVLLSSSAPTPEAGRLLLEDIARQVYAWTSQVH